MQEAFSRTRMLLGGEAMARLERARVAVFGIGGVGSYVCEALARSGVGALDLIDRDRLSLTNLNRQLIATHSTLGLYKTEVMRDRIRDIHPGARVRIYTCFARPDNMSDFPFREWDYVVDAVDTVSAKLALVLAAREAGVPVISAMGTGNKLDASRFRIADLAETRVCPLARIMRRELKRRGVEHLKVLYSEEPPLSPAEEAGEAPEEGRRSIPGSVAFVPSVAGLLIAGEVIRDLTGFPPPDRPGRPGDRSRSDA